MLTLIAQLWPDQSEWQQTCANLSETSSLSALVVGAWQIGIELARSLVESQLQQPAAVPTDWGKCPNCGSQLHSKGLQQRQVPTLVGTIRWHRRVGRCPCHCKLAQSAPLDERLGIAPNQGTSSELQRLALLLAVVVPFELAAQLLHRLCGVTITPQSIWNWTQQQGKSASDKTASAFLEPVSDPLAQLPMLIAEGRHHGAISSAA